METATTANSRGNYSAWAPITPNTKTANLLVAVMKQKWVVVPVHQPQRLRVYGSEILPVIEIIVRVSVIGTAEKLQVATVGGTCRCNIGDPP